ncbi:hypothetical protein AB0A70_06780 [Streptomyces morookaense]|uniref:hypothetical protein n=1 Tax=Streptomyces morookaense TaxID=1970 RepID=UPI0033FCF26F
MAYSYSELEGFWVDAGGDPKVAPIMAAIALAESSGIDQIQKGQPYSTTGWGLWQITPGNSVPQVGIDRALLNPLTNAKAAVAKYKSQGLRAWTTYTDGSYKEFYKGDVSASKFDPWHPFKGDTGGDSSPNLLELPKEILKPFEEVDTILTWWWHNKMRFSFMASGGLLALLGLIFFTKDTT